MKNEDKLTDILKECATVEEARLQAKIWLENKREEIKEFQLHYDSDGVITANILNILK